MNKKILMVLLLAVFVIGLGTNVYASEFEIESDADTIKAGSSFTLDIKLNDRIPKSDNIVNIQGNLTYDTQIFQYVSHKMGKNYEDFGSMNVAQKERFQFSKTSMSSTPYEIPAGTIVSIVFKTEKDVQLKKTENVFELEIKLTTDLGVTEEENCQLVIHIDSDKKEPEKNTSTGSTEGQPEKNTSAVSTEELPEKNTSAVSTEELPEKNTSAGSTEQPEKNTSAESTAESLKDVAVDNITEEETKDGISTEDIPEFELEKNEADVEKSEQEEPENGAAYLGIIGLLMIVFLYFFIKKRKK